jgi:hypothetical protein
MTQHCQQLSKEKLALALERQLCEVVSRVGVDINKAVRNPYYYTLLPYVAGLGLRKASAIVQKINGPFVSTLATRCMQLSFADLRLSPFRAAPSHPVHNSSLAMF